MNNYYFIKSWERYLTQLIIIIPLNFTIFVHGHEDYYIYMYILDLFLLFLFIQRGIFVLIKKEGSKITVIKNLKKISFNESFIKKIIFSENNLYIIIELLDGKKIRFYKGDFKSKDLNKFKILFSTWIQS